MNGEDPSLDTVVTWISLLTSLTQSPAELGPDSLSVIGKIASNILKIAASIKMPYEQATKLLDAVNTLASLTTTTFTTPVGNGTVAVHRRRLLDSASFEVVKSMMSEFSALTASSMVAGQMPVNNLQSEFRMTSVVSNLVPGAAHSVSAPVSPAEQLSGIPVASLAMTPAASGVASMTLSVTKSKFHSSGNSSKSLISNAVALNMNCATSGLRNQVVNFTIPNNEAQTYGIDATVNATVYVTSCLKDQVRSFFYTCPDVATPLRVDCTGRKGFLTSTCPQKSKVPACHVLTGTAAGINCTALREESTSAYTVCSCILCPSHKIDANGHRRELSQSSSSGSVELAALTTHVAGQFSTIMSSAASFNNADAILSTIVVIYTFLVVWIGFPGLAILYKTLRKKASKGEDEEKMVIDMHGQEHHNSVAKTVGDYVTSIIPEVYSTEKTFFQKILNELAENHPFIEVLCTEGKMAETALKALKILTTLTFSMFSLAVLYDLQYPSDDGTCALLLTQKACQSKRSMFDEDIPGCKWAADTKVCAYVEPLFSIKAYIMLTIVLSLIMVPAQTIVEMIFDRILLAPTAQEIDEEHLNQNSIASKARRLSISVGQAMRRGSVNASLAVSNVVSSARRMSVGAANVLTLVANSAGAKTRVLSRAVLMPDETKKAQREVRATMLASQSAQIQLARAKHKYESEAKAFNEEEKKNALGKPETSDPRKASVSRKFSQMSLSSGLEKHQNRKKEMREIALQSYQVLRASLMRHRATLTRERDLLEFDEQWSITVLNGPKGSVSNEDIKLYIDTKASESLGKNCKEVVKLAAESVEKIKELPPSLRGPELIRLFMLDLLGGSTPAGKIVAGKLYDEIEFYVVSWGMKCFTLAITFVINIYFIFTVMLYGANKGQGWQFAWLTSCVVNLIVLVFFNYIFEAAILNYFLPSLVEKKAMSMRVKLHEVVDKLYGQEQMAEHAPIIDSKGKKHRAFTASDYLFVSTRVARAMPELDESAIILSYHNPLPGEHQEKWRMEEIRRREMERHFAKVADPRNNFGSVERRRRVPLRVSAIEAYRRIRIYLIWLSFAGTNLLLQMGALPIEMQKIIVFTVEPVVLSGFCYIANLAYANTAAFFSFVSFVALATFAIVHYARKHKNLNDDVVPLPSDTDEQQQEHHGGESLAAIGARNRSARIGALQSETQVAVRPSDVESDEDGSDDDDDDDELSETSGSVNYSVTSVVKGANAFLNAPGKIELESLDNEGSIDFSDMSDDEEEADKQSLAGSIAGSITSLMRGVGILPKEQEEFKDFDSLDSDGAPKVRSSPIKKSSLKPYTAAVAYSDEDDPIDPSVLAALSSTKNVLKQTKHILRGNGSDNESLDLSVISDGSKSVVQTRKPSKPTKPPKPTTGLALSLSDSREDSDDDQLSSGNAALADIMAQINGLKKKYN